MKSLNLLVHHEEEFHKIVMPHNPSHSNRSLSIQITQTYELKITDFGLARMQVIENFESFKKIVGTIGWTAPEMFYDISYSVKVIRERARVCVFLSFFLSFVCSSHSLPPLSLPLLQSDVYSVAIIFWEIAYRLQNGSYLAPYKEFPDLKKDVQIIAQAAERKLRPTIPDDTDAAVRAMIEQCWEPEPEQRPTFETLLTTVASIRQRYAGERDKWDKFTMPQMPPLRKSGSGSEHPSGGKLRTIDMSL
jgi:serine/threonine protein kinase